MAKLIKTTEVVETARPGESVYVKVGLRKNAPADTQVLIYGLSAREVWLQAPGRTGQWNIPIIATSGNQLEYREVALDVSGTPAAPILELARNPFTPLGVILHADDLDPSHPILVAGDVYRWRIGAIETVTGEPVLSQNLNFQVDHQQAWTPLLAQLTVEHSDGTTHMAQRTLVLGSDYRLLRDELNQVRPLVSTDGQAKQTRQFDPTYRGSMQVRNLEPVGLRLTLRRVEWLVTDDELASYAADESIDLRIEAGVTHDLDVAFDRRQAKTGAHGAIVHLFGQSDDGMPVHTSAPFDFVRSSVQLKVEEPELVGNPSILEKVAQFVDIHGGDPYRLGEMTGGLLRLPENIRAGGLTQEHLWSLELVVGAAGRAATPGATPGAIAARGKMLPALAASLQAPVVTQTAPQQLMMDGHMAPQQLMMGKQIRTVNTWLDSVATRFGLQDSGLHSHDVAANEDQSCDPISDTAPVVEGDRCDPDNPPDQVPEFFACQYTGQSRECLVPGRVANARKGDIILVPGGNGLIGGLLAHVIPLQRYAHTGIMTRNFEQVSHATASKDWLQAHARGVDPLGSTNETQPTDGFEPDALRFQWPGGITQSVEGAYGGSEFTSPEGKKYRLAAFNLADKAFLDQQWQLIPPMVIKPHPVVEHDDPSLRKRLRRVADEARQLCVTEADTDAGRQSKVHYRFYSYSDAAVALRPSPTGVVGPAPAEAGWAAGTLPTVCSSMIWLAARRAGEKLEGSGQFTQPSDLEPDPDLLAGAQTDALTEDGLYFYTEEERAAAASWLVGYLSDEIYKTEAKKAGWFGGFVNEVISDLADDCAYQITNTFAFDWATGDAKDSDRWRNPGVGRAVSPDNLMFWDKPERDGRGLWGYVEPLVYHQAGVEVVPVTKWRKTDGPGTLKGAVRFQGQPVPGALLNAGGTMAPAGNNGEFSMTVMEGTYALKASAFINDAVGMATTTVPVEVKHDETTTVVVDLQPPPEQYRLVVIDAAINFRDDEFTFNPFEDDPDEYDSDGKYWELPVQPWDTEESTTYTRGWGGECRIEARISARLNFDRSVDVTLSGDLFEGTTENTSERDGQGSQTWHVLKDATIEPPPFRIKHDNEDDTYAEFKLKITNRTRR
jgi:hypothetical protein